MSLIWDLVNSSGPFMERSPLTGSRGTLSGIRPGRDRRSSSRKSIYIPLFVYGYSADQEPFHQETNSLQVNAGGGLLRLDAPVRCGQKLLLTNRITNQEQECFVVGLEKRPRHSDLRVGVAFEKPSLEFWKTRT
jgi:hypothetical protein